MCFRNAQLGSVPQSGTRKTAEGNDGLYVRGTNSSTLMCFNIEMMPGIRLRSWMPQLELEGFGGE